MTAQPAAIPDARMSPRGKIKIVRPDHAARYHWAAERLPLRAFVLDAGANSGYGAAILAEAGCDVVAADISERSIAWGRERWAHDRIFAWIVGDVTTAEFWQGIAANGFGLDAVVCFEVLEHLDEPAAFLSLAREHARRLLISVPNEDVWPWRPDMADNPEGHRRHYRRAELRELLASCGWSPLAWWGQVDSFSAVKTPAIGRTILAECI